MGLLQLLWIFTLQTGLVNGDLPSFNGCDGHIKSSVLEYIVRCHKLLCPASIGTRATAKVQECGVTLHTIRRLG